MTRTIKSFVASAVAIAAILMLPAAAWARPAIRILYDDINNGYFAPADGEDVAPDAPPAADEPAIDEPAAKDNNGHGNNEDGVDSSNPGGGNDKEGKDNNGHGNNEDGVDSSNPGQGGGGPNGKVDESCNGTGACVDDESKGGAASDSGDSADSGESKGNSGNNGNKGGKKK